MIVVFADGHVRCQLGASRGHRQQGQGAEQQGDWDVSPPAGPPGECFSQEGEARIGDGMAAPAPCRQDVDGEHKWHGEADKQGSRAR